MSHVSDSAIDALFWPTLLWGGGSDAQSAWSLHITPGSGCRVLLTNQLLEAQADVELCPDCTFIHGLWQKSHPSFLSAAASDRQSSIDLPDSFVFYIYQHFLVPLIYLLRIHALFVIKELLSFLFF